MADIRNNQGRNDTVVIDSMRVLDSCRDKDCFEDAPVMLCSCGRDILDSAGSVRAKSTKILGTNITVEPVQFNRGFYQIYVKFFVKVVCEACVGQGRGREFEGLAVCEKSVILYGGEGSVNIFRSEMNGESASVCGANTTMSNNLPSVVVEAIDPIILNTKIAKDCGCCCSLDEIPDSVRGALSDTLSEPDGERNLYVSLGFFSVVRIERPGQFLVSAGEYSVPDKECPMQSADDPCTAFSKMPFPVGEFTGNASERPRRDERPCGCGR